MLRRLLSIFEVTGVLIIGWTLTRIALAVLGVPDLSMALDDFISSNNNDFYALSLVGFITLLVQFLCLMIPAWLLTKMVHRGSMKDFGLTSNKIAPKKSIESAVILFCFTGIVMKCLLIANQTLDLGAEPTYWALFDKDWNLSFWIFMAVGSFVVIPVFEEIFYRGYAQYRVAQDWGFGAVLFTSALFAGAHLQYMKGDIFNIWMIASLFLLALSMGLSRHLTGSIVGAIVIHALMNIPIAPPFDILVLGLMIMVALLYRKAVLGLVREFWKGLSTTSARDVVAMLVVVVGLVTGMLAVPELAVVAFAGLFVLSIVAQVALRFREGR